jgi:hypothetical protein
MRKAELGKWIQYRVTRRPPLIVLSLCLDRCCGTRLVVVRRLGFSIKVNKNNYALSLSLQPTLAHLRRQGVALFLRQQPMPTATA